MLKSECWCILFLNQNGAKPDFVILEHTLIPSTNQFDALCFMFDNICYAIFSYETTYENLILTSLCNAVHQDPFHIHRCLSLLNLLWIISFRQTTNKL